MESFKHDVSDKAYKLGGQQCLTTLDGTVIPFALRNGLPYMDIRPCSKDEMDTLPHIILTADDNWDPSTLDHEFDPSNDYAKDFPDSTYVHDDRFTEKGEYLKRTIVDSLQPELGQ